MADGTASAGPEQAARAIGLGHADAHPAAQIVDAGRDIVVHRAGAVPRPRRIDVEHRPALEALLAHHLENAGEIDAAALPHRGIDALAGIMLVLARGRLVAAILREGVLEVEFGDAGEI